MKHTAVAIALVMVGALSLHASDRVGVYAVIDRVVFEPGAANPERVQLWGAFAVATRNNRDDYDPVQRGYMYFTAANARDLTRAEWNDLKSVAGTRKIVAFGTRFGQSVRVRGDHEKPQTPDRYETGIGVNIIQADKDYAPIRALIPHTNR